jgi:transposase
MPNILKMEQKLLIEQLLKLGWSYRRIERETRHRRETIARYDLSHPQNQEAKAAKVPAESASSPESRPKCPPTEEGQSKPSRRSLAAPYHKIISEKLEVGLTAQRIYQDLVTEHNFTDAYDSVKRYVRKLKLTAPRVYARIHTTAGEEAQVDFGQGAPTLKNSRYMRPWLFKMVLSYSRHSYEEVVWQQDIETFIRCHERAFASFPGVPGLIRLDNLKSGVLNAHLYEPILNPVYAAFAAHAGFIPLPCLPRKPEHKGKTESGVGYTQDNALKGLKFDSLEAQNAHLRHWNKTWARTRIHGTTKKQVWKLFTEKEQTALKALPEQSFQFFKPGHRKVHPDAHIEVARAYYSVPHHFIGQSLTVHYNSLWVKVFDGTQRVAFHRTTQPGRFQTEKPHLPAHKTMTVKDFENKLLRQATDIGPHCKLWALKALQVRDRLAFRPIQGVLRLKDKYTPKHLDWACDQALKLNSVRYTTIKALCEDQPQEQQEEVNCQHKLLQEHEIIRSLQGYQSYLDTLEQ